MRRVHRISAAIPSHAVGARGVDSFCPSPSPQCFKDKATWSPLGVYDILLIHILYIHTHIKYIYIYYTY